MVSFGSDSDSSVVSEYEFEIVHERGSVNTAISISAIAVIGAVVASAVAVAVPY